MLQVGLSAAVLSLSRWALQGLAVVPGPGGQLVAMETCYLARPSDWQAPCTFGACVGCASHVSSAANSRHA